MTGGGTMLLIENGGMRFNLKECKKFYKVTTYTRYTVRTTFKFNKDVFYSVDEVKAFIINVILKKK